MAFVCRSMKLETVSVNKRLRSLILSIITRRPNSALDPGDGGKSHATKIVYREFLARWVKPRWGSLNIRDVRTRAVEQWLRQLLRRDGGCMAPSTKAKIRNLMSVLFNHAIRHEWLEQGKNPILFVRQSTKRQTIPECLEPEELRALLSQLDRCFRVMVFLDAVTGLRRSELFALRWEDINFELCRSTCSARFT